MCVFSVTLLLPGPWPKLVGRWREAPDISSRGSFLKVKVIEVKGQISVTLYLSSKSVYTFPSL